mmetsp:Transcript_12021/g.17799  ORF Transcript_12021/g.17799 Transcript_12021/m.17799 type:complete len:103 (-) Transcript_12021:199-507(-)
MTSRRQLPDLYTQSEVEFSINTNGGLYKQGKAYPLQKKIEVAQKYKALKKIYGTVSSRTLAEKAGIGKTYARKVQREVDSEGLARPKKRANQIYSWKQGSHP